MGPLGHTVNCNDCNQKFPIDELSRVECSHVFCAPCVVDVALKAMKETQHRSFCPKCSKPFVLMPKNNKINFDLKSGPKNPINNHNGPEMAIQTNAGKTPLKALTDFIADWPKEPKHYTDEFIKILKEIENAYLGKQFSVEECNKIRTVLELDPSIGTKFDDNEQKYIAYVNKLINVRLPKEVVNHPCFHADCLKFDSSTVRPYIDQILTNAYKDNPAHFIYFLRPRSSDVEGNANHQHFVLSHISNSGTMQNLPVTFDSEKGTWFAPNIQGTLLIHSTLPDFLSSALNILNLKNEKILPLTRNEIYKYNGSQAGKPAIFNPKTFEQLYEEIHNSNTNWLIAARYHDSYKNQFQTHLEKLITAYYAKELSPDDLKQISALLENFKKSVRANSTIPENKKNDYDWFNIFSFTGSNQPMPVLMGVDQVQWEYLNFALNLFSPNLPQDVLDHCSFHPDCLTIDPKKARDNAYKLVKEAQTNNSSEWIYLLRQSTSGRGNKFIQKFTLTYSCSQDVAYATRVAFNSASDEWVIYGVNPDNNDEVIKEKYKGSLDEFIIEAIKYFYPSAENIKPLMYRHDQYTSLVNNL